jgi:hypothetical protein
LSAQWQRPSVERGWQVFFGGVFDLRVGMLFAARSPDISSGEDGNVHRRDGVSKTVTKNMWVGFLKNQNKKERPEKTAEGGNAPLYGVEILTEVSTGISSHPLILAGMSGFLSVLFSRCARLTLKSASRIARKKKVSGFQPERLKETSFPAFNDAPLMSQRADAFIKLTTLPSGLTPLSIPTPDKGVKTPSTADVLTTCFDVRLLDEFVRLLATEGRHVDVEVFLIKNFNMLKTMVSCQFFVDKKSHVLNEVRTFFEGEKGKNS